MNTDTFIALWGIGSVILSSIPFIAYLKHSNERIDNLGMFGVLVDNLYSRFGGAWRGMAGQGGARLGMAWQGAVWPGGARQGLTLKHRDVRR